MAELAALPSFASVQLQSNHLKATDFMRWKVHFRIVERKQFPGQPKILVRFQLREVCKLSSRFATTMTGKQYFKHRAFRCPCLGTLTNPDSPLTMDWVPVMDHILLIASAIFAYTAGIITPEKAHLTAKMYSSEQDPGTANSTSSGSAMRSGDLMNLDYAWDEVQRKLVDALDAIEHDGNLDNRVVQCENSSGSHPLSLHAIAGGPRLRLLSATLQQLQKEVNNIPSSSELADRDDWLVVLSGIIRVSVQPVCAKWLQEELCLERKHHKKDVLTRMFDKMREDTVLRNIRKSGKEDLYADLLFFLRFGSLRTGSHYNSKLLNQHGVGILEDLLITLADGIASMYLELISVDSTVSSEMCCLGLILCSLSTRELQRLRNEVAFNQWLHQNIKSVVAMYEDRFDLCALQTQLVEEPDKSRRVQIDWWKKLTLKTPASIPSSLSYVVISQLSLPVKRTEELRALTGWRYYFSLFLEFSDISMPLVRAVFAKVSNAISFFLVCLIGRSLGLIYTGIRQSLGWK